MMDTPPTPTPQDPFDLMRDFIAEMRQWRAEDRAELQRLRAADVERETSLRNLAAQHIRHTADNQALMRHALEGMSEHARREIIEAHKVNAQVVTDIHTEMQKIHAALQAILQRLGGTSPHVS